MTNEHAIVVTAADVQVWAAIVERAWRQGLLEDWSIKLNGEDDSPSLLIAIERAREVTAEGEKTGDVRRRYLRIV